jgi:hypothetical protein
MKSISTVRMGAAIALLQSTACISVTHTQTADTVGDGNLQFAVAPTYAPVGDKVIDANNFLGGAQAHVLYGAQDNVDVGIRAGYQRLFVDGADTRLSSYGVDVLSKFQFVRKDALRVSLAPSIGYRHVREGDFDVSNNGLNVLQAQLPLLVGIPLGNHQFVVGPTVTDVLFLGGDTPLNLLNVGATAGLALKIPGMSVRIMPEVGIFYPLLGTAPSVNQFLTDWRSPNLQFSLGFMFGGGIARPPH